jgi:hypothetical protein
MACFHASRNDCAWFGRQPRLPLLRLNSLEMVDYGLPNGKANHIPRANPFKKVYSANLKSPSQTCSDDYSCT